MLELLELGRSPASSCALSISAIAVALSLLLDFRAFEEDFIVVEEADEEDDEDKCDFGGASALIPACISRMRVKILSASDWELCSFGTPMLPRLEFLCVLLSWGSAPSPAVPDPSPFPSFPTPLLPSKRSAMEFAFPRAYLDSKEGRGREKTLPDKQRHIPLSAYPPGI